MLSIFLIRPNIENLSLINFFWNSILHIHANFHEERTNKKKTFPKKVYGSLHIKAISIAL